MTKNNHDNCLNIECTKACENDKEAKRTLQQKRVKKQDRNWRKQPFSGKQKREQLQQRKLRNNERKHRQVEQRNDDLKSNQQNDEQLISQFGEATSVQREKQMHTIIVKESVQSIAKKRDDAIRPFKEMYMEDIYRDPIHKLPRLPQSLADVPLYMSMPIRPSAVNTQRTAKQMHEFEVEIVDSWAKNVIMDFQNYRTSDEESNSDIYFERNVEVWRQVWRLMDRSQIIVCTTPIQYPHIQIPAPVVKEATVRGIPVICVLTKKDLLPDSDGFLVQAWIDDIKHRFPEFYDVVALSADSFGSMKKVGQSERWAGHENDGFDRFLHSLLSTQFSYRGWTGCLSDAMRNSARKDEEFSRGARTVMESMNNPNAVLSEFRAQPCTPNSDNNLVDEINFYHKHTTLEAKEEFHTTYDAETSEFDANEIPYLYAAAAKWRNERKFDKGHCAQPSRDYIAIGFVGEPNTGKSALINRMLQRSAAGVSYTPGKTKHLQTHFLAADVAILDCPGLIFPKVNVPRSLGVLCGNLAVSQCREPYSAILLLCKFLSLDAVAAAHGLALVQESGLSISPYELMEELATKWKFFIPRTGRPDAARAANRFLRLLLLGKPIALCFYPPL